jgi:aminodeoxychorismate synthase component I
VLLLDHARSRVLALGLGFAGAEAEAEARAEHALEELLARLAAPAVTVPAASVRRETPHVRAVSSAQYAARVRAVKARIEAGDVYQVCLTHRLETECDADPFALYSELRRLSPAPFAAFFELDEVCLLSSSPERFLQVDAAGRAETRPIKGTRPRGEDLASDAKQRTELAASAKDRAENVMIVDLARNDLGRVCATGSVAVPELCAIEAYATVFQLVSTVTGRLAPGRDALDLVRAAFPPGSMTGAPKLAALRILDRLEPDARGFYGGALGYFDVRGGADLSVVIRTVELRAGRAGLHVGGGIVADSDPAAEYAETMDKASALVAALAATDEAVEAAGGPAAGGEA